LEEFLKEKIREALLEATGPQAHVELEDVPPDKVAGLVLSDTFATLTPSKRQDHIWSFLDRHLTPFERTRVVFIVADTRDEYDALRQAAG
jgi:hypothetical protein